MMKYACQPFNWRDARATTRSLAYIIRASLLGEIPIFSALCSVCVSAYLGLLRAVFLLRRSRS